MRQNQKYLYSTHLSFIKVIETDTHYPQFKLTAAVLEIMVCYTSTVAVKVEMSVPQGSGKLTSF